MGEKTAISWCDHTFNLWWGCDHASRLMGPSLTTAPECDNCYAEAFDKRLGGHHWGYGSPRKFFGEKYWDKLWKWNDAALLACERRSVFVSSMSDIGEIHPNPSVNAEMDAARASFFDLARKLEGLDFLLLTKRPENLAVFLPWMQGPGAECDWCCGADKIGGHERNCPVAMPWPNIWLGTTCGARSSLWRIRELRRVPAAHRYVSVEPLLEHITTEEWIAALRSDNPEEDGMEWLIVGHENAPKGKIRAAELEWAKSARDAALACGMKFHFKQWHDGKKVVHLPLLDGRQWTATPNRD